MRRTVLVVEDDQGLREEVMRILELAPDLHCLGGCTSAEEALRRIAEKQPDVVLMDIKLPSMSGIQCVAEIKDNYPDMAVIMVTVFEDSERIFRALRAGASGYFVKSDSPDKLLGAIRDVYAGSMSMSVSIARKVVKHFHLIGSSPQETDSLSNRERVVLDLLAQGMICREISNTLEIGPETVRTYVKNICTKMHVRSRIEAVAAR